MVMHCPECGAENPDGAEYCNLCLSSLGFESEEFVAAEIPVEESTPRYPSSFRPDEADMGEGTASQGAALPADYSSPGDWTERGSWEDEDAATGVGATVFHWGSGLFLCFYASLVAGAVTLGLQLLLGLAVLDPLLSGNISIDYTWIFVVLMLPACASAFYVGYRTRSYGWAMGMMTAALWAIIMKPLFNLAFRWITDPSHISSPLPTSRIALDLCVAVPLGALLGWLGQRRAVRRITIRS